MYIEFLDISQARPYHACIQEISSIVFLKVIHLLLQEFPTEQ